MNTITDFMARDHDRLDALFSRFQAAKTRVIESAVRLFSEFKRGLQRHILWEEQILFPVFEGRTGMEEQGPTAVMRMEHRQIKGFLEQIHDHIAKKETDTDGFEQDLVETLAEHNRKEETILYPWIDRCVSGREAETLMTRMKAVPEEEYHHCCGSSDVHHDEGQSAV
jgi:regulator of cell morphogenesis and NO signaling